MSSVSGIEGLAGATCPHPDCDGTVVREEEGVACRACDRWLVRRF